MLSWISVKKGAEGRRTDPWRRPLEEEFRYDPWSLLATDAGTEIVKRGPRGMHELEDYIVAIKHDLSVLQQTEGHHYFLPNSKNSPQLR